MQNPLDNASISELQIQILETVRMNPKITYDKMQAKIGKNRTTIMRNIQRLKEAGVLQRIGSKKTGS